MAVMGMRMGVPNTSFSCFCLSQLRDLAATRLRLARLAHPRAARSEETTSSAEPVVE
jgi:hypothetical protein